MAEEGHFSRGQRPSSPWTSGSWLVHHWERALLLGMVLAMAVMVIGLLLPHPQTVITLQPFTESSGLQLGVAQVPEASEVPTGDESISEDEASSEANSLQQVKHRRKKHHRASRASHKKPAKPPITNLNTANASQLQLLQGIGPAMAGRIIEYRKISGGFKSIEQVMDVKGIGPKKFEKMRPFLKV